MVYASDNSITQLFLPPVPQDIASFWSQAGGNPSGNRTAATECPCLVAGDEGTSSSGSRWNIVGATQAASLSVQGYSALQARVSSVRDFNTQLTTNGMITGGVIYIGHGGSVASPPTFDGALFPGEGTGPDMNITYAAQTR